MPEIIEVSNLAVHLQSVLRDARLMELVGHPRMGLIQPPATENHLRQLCDGNTRVDKVDNYAKYLFFHLVNETLPVQDYVLMSHFRFTGWWTPEWKIDTQSFIHSVGAKPYIEILTDRGMLYYTDPRALGSIWIMRRSTWGRKSPHLRLGPPVTSAEFTVGLFVERCKKGNLPICDVIIDQRAFSGIGNYLRAEVLYRSEQNPFQISSSIPQTQLENIYYHIQLVLDQARQKNNYDWFNVFRRKLTQGGHQHTLVIHWPY